MLYVAGISKHSNNQSFTVDINGIDYRFIFHTFRDILYCSIAINGTLVVAGVKCINDTWLIPFKYLTQGGNFRFENSYDDYVDPEYFGDITQLVYYSASELAKMS